jgi:CyaY protein
LLTAADAVVDGAAALAAVGIVKAPFWPHAETKHKAVAMPSVRTVGLATRRRKPLATLEIKFIRRILSTMTQATPPTSQPAASPDGPVSDADFHRLAHAVLSAIEAATDRWLDDDVVDIDSQRTGGLLELSLPGGSKIILNTQPPLQEIWLAAKAGGHHYRLVAGRWLDTRDGSEFFAALSQHASAQAGQTLVFAPPT